MLQDFFKGNLCDFSKSRKQRNAVNFPKRSHNMTISSMRGGKCTCIGGRVGLMPILNYEHTERKRQRHIIHYKLVVW